MELVLRIDFPKEEEIRLQMGAQMKQWLETKGALESSQETAISMLDDELATFDVGVLADLVNPFVLGHLVPVHFPLGQIVACLFAIGLGQDNPPINKGIVNQDNPNQGDLWENFKNAAEPVR